MRFGHLLRAAILQPPGIKTRPMGHTGHPDNAHELCTWRVDQTVSAAYPLSRKAPTDRRQSPVPGFSEKYFSNLPSTSLKSSASGGDSFLAVMFGHLSA